MLTTTILFPGQGSQYVGMGKALYERSSEARKVFEEAEDVLKINLRKLCFEGDLEELTKTENAQPAILTCSVAAFNEYMHMYGMEPSYCAGHSLGEYSALTCAGVLKFSDAVSLVRQRGKYMQEAAAAGSGAMAAVSGIKSDELEEMCREYSGNGETVVISNYNSPDQIVISGHKNTVEILKEKLESKGARIVPLRVSAPFHSPLMQTAADKLIRDLEKCTYGEFKFPVVSNVTALPYPDKDSVAGLLTRQMTHAVQWTATMKYLNSKDVKMFVEIGPQTVLRNLSKRNIPDAVAYSYDKEDDRNSIGNNIKSGGDSDKAGEAFKPSLVTRCIAASICTRNRNWNNDEYKKGVIEPYRSIVKIQETLDLEKRQPTLEEMEQALDLLIRVFRTKKLTLEEQVARINEVFDSTGTRHLFKNFIMPDKLSS